MLRRACAAASTLRRSSASLASTRSSPCTNSLNAHIALAFGVCWLKIGSPASASVLSTAISPPGRSSSQQLLVVSRILRLVGIEEREVECRGRRPRSSSSSVSSAGRSRRSMRDSTPALRQNGRPTARPFRADVARDRAGRRPAARARRRAPSSPCTCRSRCSGARRSASRAAP